MMYLFRKTVFNCKQATLLSIKKAEGKISFFENVKLSYHLLYCDPCKRFIEQWHKLDDAGRELGTGSSQILSAAAKERMEARIKN